MEISVSAEALVFLKTVLGGALCGMIFDIYRILKSVKKSTFVIEAGDIIVWIAAAMMSFFAVFFANSGEVRWYEIAALLTGFVLYTVSVSKYFIAFVKFSAKFFAKTLKIMLMPVVRLLKAVKSIGLFIFSYVKKPFVFVEICLKLQKKRINFIKNKQIFDFRRLKRIFQKN